MTRKSLLRVRPFPTTFEEALEWLRRAGAIPVWTVTAKSEPPVIFRRLAEMDREPWFEGGRHIAGERTRMKIVELLGIKTKEDCGAIRELVKK